MLTQLGAQATNQPGMLCAGRATAPHLGKLADGPICKTMGPIKPLSHHAIALGIEVAAHNIVGMALEGSEALSCSCIP